MNKKQEKRLNELLTSANEFKNADVLARELTKTIGSPLEPYWRIRSSEYLVGMQTIINEVCNIMRPAEKRI